MNKINEVKKILSENYATTDEELTCETTEEFMDRVSTEINQLYEMQPSQTRLGIEQIVIKVWDMSQASNEHIARLSTLTWAIEELEKLCY